MIRFRIRIATVTRYGEVFCDRTFMEGVSSAIVCFLLWYLRNKARPLHCRLASDNSKVLCSEMEMNDFISI